MLIKIQSTKMDETASTVDATVVAEVEATEVEAAVDATEVVAAVDATVEEPSVLIELPSADVAPIEELPTLEEVKSKIPEEDMEGLQSLHNLTLSIGIPITKKILHYLIDFSKMEKSEKISAYAFVASLSPITEIGCMKIEYKSVLETQTSDLKTKYMLFDECAKDYDLGGELDKIKNEIAVEKWPEVLHHASMLVFYCRIVYSKLVRENLEQIKKWFRREDGADCEDLFILKVDPVNTTLYCEALVEYPKRVGIRVCD